VSLISVAALVGVGVSRPASVTVVALEIGFVGVLALTARQASETSVRAGSPSRVIVFGAGEGGEEAIAAMLRDPAGGYLPVTLLDDDPLKSGRKVGGLAVHGDRGQLPRVVSETNADLLLVAIPTADAALIAELGEKAGRLGLALRVLPPVHELGESITVTDIREPSYADLLGRREIDLDLDSIAGYLAGRRILVTGAGGSIGSELCRQLSRQHPSSLVMLDRDESALHGVQLSIEGQALLDSRRLVVADIRDWQRMAEVFAEHRPQVVFHAAALKHLPLLEMHPAEAVKSNVWGTWNVLEAAANAGVDRFVNISTDKAADPVSVLGASKRAAERLAAWFDDNHPMRCMSVRFGNVLGSRGSVLTTFQSQIAAGHDVTVTDPHVTRYFMTVEEAVALVIQAGAVGHGGEALVLDMGQPMRIADVARRLIEAAHSHVHIVYTGLRPGEKLHEALLSVDEEDHRPVHPLISHAPVPPLAPSVVSRLSCLGTPEQVAGALAEAIRTKMSVLAPAPPRPRRSVALPGDVTAGSRMRRASDPLPTR
jgi:FlaA1/EpsC-like NDP-sugar epimerase